MTRNESTISRMEIILHGASLFFTFLAICLTAAVAAFQAKWVKVSGGTAFVLFLVLLAFTVQCCMLAIPIAYDRWSKAAPAAKFLHQPRAKFILDAFCSFLMITAAVIASAAGFGAHCKGWNKSTSSSSDDSAIARRDETSPDTTGSTEKDMSGFESGFAGWCRTRQASAMFMWFAFFCWMALAVFAGLAFRKERQLSRRREPAFAPPDDAFEYGNGIEDDVFDDKHEAVENAPPNRVPSARPQTHDYARVQTSDSAMARPSVDAYGAFDGDMPGSEPRMQTSRTLQMAYNDPYAQIRQTVLGETPQYNLPPSYSGGYR